VAAGPTCHRHLSLLSSILSSSNTGGHPTPAPPDDDGARSRPVGGVGPRRSSNLLA
jgi:hypothetical protein